MSRWRKAISLGLIIGAAVLGGTALRAEEPAFVGAKNCKKCHMKQYKSWEQTEMAQTFEVLKPGVAADAKEGFVGVDPQGDYTADANCLSCHTTGYGLLGGFTSIEETPALAGVGCESCHGPGSLYLEDGLMTLKNKEYKLADLVAAGMVEKVSEAQCITCHNADTPLGDALVFSFDEAKDADTHEHFPLKYEH